MRGLNREGTEAFQRILAPTERLVFASRQHWLVLWKPTLYAVLGLLVVGYSALNLTAKPGERGGTLLALIALGIVLYWLFEFLTWRRQWFGVTPKRLLFLEGLVDTEVQMMPLGKLTDMTYRRTWIGDIVGYAHFVVESAGQKQALERLRFIPDADQAREEITKYLFGFFPTVVKYADDAVMARPWHDPDDPDDWVDEGDPDDPGDGPEDSSDALDLPEPEVRDGERLPRHAAGPSYGEPSLRSRTGPRGRGARSRGRRDPRTSETVYRSPDLRREDDTAPLPVIPVRRDNGPLYPPSDWV